MQIQGQARIDPASFQSLVVTTATQMKYTPTVITEGTRSPALSSSSSGSLPLGSPS